ncbi:STAS domain-containing protein [Wenjunlia tyrosinilytica]|uniref:STAS domain-containing protein n=1 Tax=Wenjunlia tyrosinilytica TaxID=1544741 RepID=A0A917ZKN5_9ACTN|nr:STAS domain-containing protein [Wenjunlia tyrosinilytica]GGO83858.1 hypothetical protein GCM10012280_13990 [Wenjunlia tyrosinilytica]
MAAADSILQVRAAIVDEAALIALRGEIDLDTAPRVKEAVQGCLPHHPRSIEIDLSGVAFCGCAGLNTLLWARAEATRAHSVFRLIAPGPQPVRLFTLTGTARTLGLVEPPRLSSG